jgi:hypothetical protein
MSLPNLRLKSSIETTGEAVIGTSGPVVGAALAGSEWPLTGG